MQIIVSREAASQLEEQLRYLQSQGAHNAADDLRRRVMQFLSQHVAEFPRAGRYLPNRDIWETWIPRTRLVLWYRIGSDHIEIATVWHSARDRYNT